MIQDLQRNHDPDIILYQVEDIQRIFGIGRTKAYRLMGSKGFPSITLNKRRVVQKDRLEIWLSQQSGKTLTF